MSIDKSKQQDKAAYIYNLVAFILIPDAHDRIAANNNIARYKSAGDKAKYPPTGKYKICGLIAVSLFNLSV